MGERIKEGWGDKKASKTLKEFEQLLDEQNVPPQYRDILFYVYDINHNGKISWVEYVCTLVLVTHGTPEEKIEVLFNTFDHNRDGRISKREFSDAVMRLTDNVDVCFINEVFEKVVCVFWV
uniref:EF-hand domain-containing protein n=1 Tax=Arcella intermedia TaxID=1963864 RepID=A0A6B2LQL5_9EUKA